MLRILVTILFFSISGWLYSQQQSVDQLRATALSFQRNQDFSNAIMVLDRALQMEPGNLQLQKDVAYAYYLSGDLENAAIRARPLVDREDADEQAYQIAAHIFRTKGQARISEKILKSGLKKFEGSGPLCSEMGELYWEKENPSQAIKFWETGVVSDPSYSGNYYHAAKFYYAAGDKARSIIYGEIFLNLESYSPRSNEIKILLLESYKRAYMPADQKQYYIKPTTEFERDILSVLQRQSALVVRGIDTETLYILRSRFILDWFNSFGGKYKFQLFDHMRYMMRVGIFEAYNQWIFGTASDPNAFVIWANTNSDAYQAFLRMQQNQLFTMPSGQYYF